MKEDQEARMAMYPEQLVPETVEDLRLPSGLNVQIPKAHIRVNSSRFFRLGGLLPGTRYSSGE